MRAPRTTHGPERGLARGGGGDARGEAVSGGRDLYPHSPTATPAPRICGGRRANSCWTAMLPVAASAEMDAAFCSRRTHLVNGRKTAVRCHDGCPWTGSRHLEGPEALGRRTEAGDADACDARANALLRTCQYVCAGVLCVCAGGILFFEMKANAGNVVGFFFWMMLMVLMWAFGKKSGASRRDCCVLPTTRRHCACARFLFLLLLTNFVL